ncbi:cardiac-enriched FHL2-interacting protein [Pagrus major]|uniref:cardiac-enriched FHL2-interacting protein n=1 Tax=Pagrus major TaxID=143350 RepID=UPI003CC83CC0
MTSVEKRRSGRKSGGHRKHSDGGYSDTSSGGSFLDETDREVSNLTDRAFRSLCIGDEAVYNDSDLCSSSPCIQRDRQLAFSQSEQDRDREDREREELKRAAHESFSLRVQQYGQDLIHGGMYGAKIHRDPQWEVYGERTQGRVSATFQHSFVETSQQEESLREEQLSFFSNGATELSSQQRRSRSRVSSLIRAFNSEGQRDGAGMDGKPREWNDETSWDKSALMSIQRELSEFSTPYQPNFNSGHFPSAGPFPARDTNFYSAAVANMNSSSSLMRSSHSKHSMSAQVNCNSNFFIHSEFSPFKVWRDHNRFPFQQGDVSGFMHCSEFPKWYETPMYKELSLEAQPQGPYRFDERGIRHQRNTMAPMVPATPSRSTSTSTMLQKALSVEKRCESELIGHYPHRKRTQSLGANRFPSQRPSTASPTVEMSRRVQETISSVKALQQKIKMMTEQNISAGMTANQQGALYSNDNSVPFGNNAPTVAPNVVSSNTSTTPFNISQLLTPSVHAHQEAETSEVRQYAASPQPVEHPPVRAESRGATPDIRMSSYKSRATSLLFNLKDNRKRVKSTYSPPKFKGLETPEKNKQHIMQEPRDTVIDIPDFPDQDIQFTQVEATSHQYVNQYHNPGLPLTTINSQPVTTHTGQYSEYTSSDYQTAKMQGEMVHHSGTGFIPENYPTNQLANGQYLHEDLSSFAPCKQGMLDFVETQGGDAHRLKPSYTAAETPRLNADNTQTREYLISKANTEQHFNETAGRESTKVDRYQQLIDNKHDYNNVSSPDRWRQTNSQDTENLSLRTAISPWKQEITASMEKDQPHNYYGHSKENEMKDNHLTQNSNRYTDQEYGNQHCLYSNKDKTMLMQETGSRKPLPKGHELQSLQTIEAKPQFEHNKQKNSLSNPNNASAPTMGNEVERRQFAEVKAEQASTEHMKAQHAQAELAKAQRWAQVEQPKVESARLILAGQTGSEKVKAEQAKAEVTEHDRVNQASAEHIKDKTTKGEETEPPREKQSEREQTEAEQTRKQTVTEEPKNITEEAGVRPMREVQGEQVKAEQAEAERLKEEHIKTELAETEQAEQARIKQAETEQARGEKLKAEQLEEEKVRAAQVEREQMEAEQIRTEKVKADQAEAERRKAEQAKLEQMKEQQAKTEKEKTEVVEDISIQGSQVNAEQPTTQISKAKEENIVEKKAEQPKLEQTKLGLAKAEQAKTESMQERFTKPAAKLTQQVKIEPDKVEQVKTELAKAKAELAKIKEKMRGEQKEKARNHLNKKKENPSKATVLVEAESSKPMNTEKAESKHGAEDSALSLSLCFGQNETPVADDNLQIMGIMVTVREREPSESSCKSTQEQINAKEKECSNSELDKCHPSSGVEISEGNKSSKEVSRVKAGDRVVQNALKEDQNKVSMDNHPENVQETLTHETRQNNVSGDVTVKKTNFQQVCTSTNTRSQRETQPPTVTVPAKNKMSAETQPLLYKRDTIARETKDYTNKTANENSAKSKSFPNKTKVTSKVNKEPKPLVFPITEKEHQRTGMFKLGDKERQEKMLLDAKANDDLKERNKSPITHLKNLGSEEQGSGADTQRLLQVDQSLHQPSSSLYAPTSSSAVNRPRNTPGSHHLKPVDNSNPHERVEDCSSKAEKLPYLDKNSHPRSTLGQMYNIEDNQQQEKLRKEGLAPRHEETKAKQSRAKQPEEEQASGKEVKTRTEGMKIRHMLEDSRASLAEEERRAAQREEERRAREREAIASKIKEKRQKQREAERRAEEERKAKQIEEERAAQEEEERRAKQREEERRMKETEEKRRIQMEEERRVKLREEEERIRENEEKRREKQKEEERAARKEQQRRAAQEEQQRRAAQEEQHRRAAQEEQQRRAAQEEQQKRAAQEEQQRRAAQEEQQRRAAQEEQQRRAAQEEQQRRAAQEEQQRQAEQEEQQRRAAQEEQQRRAALIKEQQRKAAQEEQQRRAAQEEQQRRAALIEEQQRKAAQEEQQRRAALIEEQQRKAAQEEQQRKTAQEEQQRAALIEEQQRKAAQEEQQRRAAQEEQQRTALIEKQQMRAAQEEQQRRAAQEEQQRREKKRKQKEEEKAAQLSKKESIKETQEQKQAEHLIEKQRGERQRREEWMRTRREEAERKIVQGEKTITNQREEKQAKEESTRLLEESRVALIEQKRVAHERMLAQREDEIRAKKREEEEKIAAYREKERVAQMEEQKRAAQKMEVLQYYAITSTESERKPRERPPCSPLPSQRRNNTPGLESAEDHHSRSYRPHAPVSPAPSLPRSNTSSPALGVKPLMFRVKDNTMRGSFTKSVKPRFHKNFGDDFRVGSPMGSERGEEEQETIRRSAVTPVHPDTGLNRLAAIKESSTFQPGSSLQDYSAPPQHHRPYSRRSLALDEDDSRSIISNISEDVESFATSAADLAELRGLYDYDRPESACSFSSDVSRSLGKPPAVPPKSEKALRRAQRLTTRRIKKELSKGVADSAAGIKKPLQEASSTPFSSSTEVCSSNRHAVASPHFSPPVSLAHAPAPGSSLPEHQSHSSFYASPHATGPISLPVASPHATAPVSLPVASPHVTGPASHSSAKIVADVPSSPTLHHANHPAPVTQYHVESGYPQAYPLTQRKVLQDLGSGQYFVVDVPVQVKTKTFFDPETGKYVQLNVRESAKTTSRSQPQQTYLQPQLQPQINVKPQQQQPPSQNSPASKPHVLYQGFHGYPQGNQPAAVNSGSHNRSSAPVNLHTDQQESHIYGYPAPEMGQNSEGHRYSPEKTPYMDTVNDKDKICDTVYNTHECDTNSQLAGSSVCENGNPAHSRCQPRDIITMSELEDFMDLSDW